MFKIIIINGPNMNVIEQRDHNIYGHETLEIIERSCLVEAKRLSLSLDFLRTNSESKIIDSIQNVNVNYDGLIINAGGYSHTSIAIMDALSILTVPIVEVHLSNIHSREEYRSKSYISRVVDGTICGFHGYGYVLALQAIENILLVSDKILK